MLLVLSFAVAYASTNLDNLALLIVLAPSLGLVRVGSAFLLTQLSVVALAFAVGAAADNLTTAWLGWLGLVPIALGLRELWRQWRPDTATPEAGHLQSSGMAALLVTFGGLSFDTFALTAAFLADSAPTFDLHVLTGAVLGLALICFFGFVVTRATHKAADLVTKLNRLTPFIMIAAGLYIIADTLTDQV